jgi:group II intron reverse transcriptase/maturase
MQTAEVVLEILRDRGRRGLPVDELYRQMFNPSLYLMAWGRIYANHGAMTPGATGETADGMSAAKIEGIIELMRAERYRFAPARRVWIPKKSGGQRPLGMPTWSDKLVGEVVRLLLEAYYEPTFSDRSHGFRPGRGCHTALREIANTWTGTTWFIEGDIKDCFGSLDHQVLLGILAERIHDGRFIELVRRMLTSGYLEDWVWRETLSGAPQGGVVSPILSNIYLDKLDRFVEDELIPRHTRGTGRARNRAYDAAKTATAKARRGGDRERARRLRALMRSMPSGDTADPGYRRLRYSRYADDHILGFIGPKREAEQIKGEIAAFLRDALKLELSQPKTLITHARTGAARYLGYHITIGHDQTALRKGRRSQNGTVKLRVPGDVVRAKAAGFLKGGKPRHTDALFPHGDHAIVGWYGAKDRGIVNYYKLAANIHVLGRLRWVLQTSMLKTLAGKHRSTVAKIAARYKTKITTPHGLRTCFEARLDRSPKPPLVARFGEVPLRRDMTARIADPALPDPLRPPKEIIRRVRSGLCELCGTRPARVEVHQVRGLAALDPATEVGARMLAMRRKTIVLCPACHARTDPAHAANTSPPPESRMR